MINPDKQIIVNALWIAEGAAALKEQLESYGTFKRPLNRDEALGRIKELRSLLVKTMCLIEQVEGSLGRNLINTSDTQPCVLCNDHYAVPGEHVKGVRYEAVVGKGWVYICWECAVALEKMLHAQVASLAYTFLFSLSKETKALREATMPRLVSEEQP